MTSLLDSILMLFVTTRSCNSIVYSHFYPFYPFYPTLHTTRFPKNSDYAGDSMQEWIQNHPESPVGCISNFFVSIFTFNNPSIRSGNGRHMFDILWDRSNSERPPEHARLSKQPHICQRTFLSLRLPVDQFWWLQRSGPDMARRFWRQSTAYQHTRDLTHRQDRSEPYFRNKHPIGWYLQSSQNTNHFQNQWRWVNQSTCDHDNPTSQMVQCQRTDILQETPGV